MTGAGDGGAEPRSPRHPLFLWLAVIAGLAMAGGWVHFSGAVSGRIPAPDMQAAAALFYLVLFVPLAALAWLLGHMCDVPAIRPGRHPARFGALGLVAGSLGLAVAFALTAIRGGIGDGPGESSLGPALLLGLALTLIQTAAEEMLFRGWLQGVLTRLAGPLPGLALGALCFAAMHLAGGPVSGQAFINLTLAGLFFGLLAWKSGGLVAPIAAHFGWNAVEDLGLGLVPNPGIGPFGAIRDIDIAGPAIWGGSAVGLNASIGTSVVLLVLVIALTPWKRHQLTRNRT